MNEKILVIGEMPTSTDFKAGTLKTPELISDILPGAHYATLLPAPQRTVTPKDLKAQLPRIQALITLHKPKVVVTLGVNVLKTLTNKARISELHGQPIQHQNYTLVPTFALALLVREPAKLGQIQQDLNAAKRALSPAAPKDALWELVETKESLDAFTKAYQEANTVAIDIETTGLDPRAKGAKVNMVQFGLPDGTNWALQMGHPAPPWFDDGRFLSRLARATKTVVGHNFKFDNGWLNYHYGVTFPLSFDTMLAHHLLDENSPHGLKELASRYVGAPQYSIDKQTLVLANGADRAALGRLAEYGCYDVAYTLQLYRVFKRKLAKDARLSRLFYHLVMPAARVFEKVESKGLYIDMDALATVGKALERTRVATLAELETHVASPINWHSLKQVRALLYNDFGLTCPELTPTGEQSTSEQVLAKLDHPVPRLLLRYRAIEKNLSTYIYGWPQLMHGNHLYLTTNLHGTVTGRYSSRLHQVPRDPQIRSIITATPGYQFVSADFGQIELRLAAHLANEESMLTVFRDGGDIHAATAAALTGKPVDCVTKPERTLAKAINFGLLYGMGWRTLKLYALDTYGIALSSLEAQDFRAKFFETYPNLLIWHAEMRAKVKNNGYVRSLSGRIRRLSGIDSTDESVRSAAERNSINSPVQGFGSGDMKAMALVEIAHTLPDVRIVGEVHDSILMEVPHKRVTAYLPIIRGIMQRPKLLNTFEINLNVPIHVDFEVGAWGMGETKA